MRQLLGKMSVKHLHFTEVYLSEQVRCHDCQRMVPMGIEVVTVRKEGEARKVINRRCYCRAHGSSIASDVLS